MIACALVRYKKTPYLFHDLLHYFALSKLTTFGGGALSDCLTLEFSQYPDSNGQERGNGDGNFVHREHSGSELRARVKIMWSSVRYVFKS